MWYSLAQPSIRRIHTSCTTSRIVSGSSADPPGYWPRCGTGGTTICTPSSIWRRCRASRRPMPIGSWPPNSPYYARYSMPMTRTAGGRPTADAARALATGIRVPAEGRLGRTAVDHQRVQRSPRHLGRRHRRTPSTPTPEDSERTMRKTMTTHRGRAVNSACHDTRRRRAWIGPDKGLQVLLMTELGRLRRHSPVIRCANSQREHRTLFTQPAAGWRR